MMKGSTKRCFWLDNKDEWLVGMATPDLQRTSKLKVTKKRSYRNVLLPPTFKTQPIIANTGATSHYITASHTSLCHNVHETDKGPSVKAANGQIMTATHRATLPLPLTISTAAKTGQILDSLQTGSLLSIGKLCDNNCTATFTKDNVFIKKEGSIQITGHGNRDNSLWNIPLSTNKEVVLNTTEVANGAISNPQTKYELAAFNHGTVFLPRPSTLLRA